MVNRLNPKERKEQILTKALELAAESHYMLVTQQEIAEALNISPSLVLAYFNTMDELRYAITQKAFDTVNQRVMVQAASIGSKLDHTIPSGGSE